MALIVQFRLKEPDSPVFNSCLTAAKTANLFSLLAAISRPQLQKATQTRLFKTQFYTINFQENSNTTKFQYVIHNETGSDIHEKEGSTLKRSNISISFILPGLKIEGT